MRYSNDMINSTRIASLDLAVAFYATMRTEYAPRAALGLAVAYLARKTALDFQSAEPLLRAALSNHKDYSNV